MSTPKKHISYQFGGPYVDSVPASYVMAKVPN